MNDVNLTSPNLKLIIQNDQKAARVSASSQAKSPDVPAYNQPIGLASALVETNKPSQAEGLRAEKQAQVKELKDSVSQLNHYVQSVNRNLEFKLDNETGQTVVKVVDRETDEVIRQIPDELALRLAEKLQQDEPLTLLNIEV